MKCYLTIEFRATNGVKSYGVVSTFNKAANLVKFTEKRKSFSSVELANSFGEKILSALNNQGYINIVDEIMGMSFTVNADSLNIKVVHYN